MKDDAFKDVIGYEKEKEKLLRFLDIISNKEKYLDLGVAVPKGILLDGPPGVGKSTMANAFIVSSQRPAYVIRKDLSDGEFLKFINNTFQKAKKNAPSIILLDDIDKFSSSSSYNTNTEEYVTIQTQLDNIVNEDIFVLATSNFRRYLPESLTRSGRFEVIEIKNPTLDDSKKIFQHYLHKVKISQDVDVSKLSQMLIGFNCADLLKITEKAALEAGFKNKKKIGMEELTSATLAMLYGTNICAVDKASKFLDSTVYHEAGHVLLSTVLEGLESVSFASVGLGQDSNIKGITIYSENNEYFNDFSYQENRVKCLLAGLAAESVALGKISVGSNEDVNRAMNIITRIVDDFNFIGFDSHQCHCDNTYYSDTFKQIRENKINILVNKYYREVLDVIIKNKGFLDAIAQELKAKKILFSEDIKKIKEESYND